MEQKENLIDKEFSLAVVLPGGVEKITTVHGSKPLMDLLVMLCAKYHLNPSSYTLEPVTANRNHIKFKPNTLIGTLEAEKIILKAKGAEDEGKKVPRMPEATVRMLINYKNTQKTILRVNPRVPLAELLPAICEKCEFDVETTVLLRDLQSLAPLDLTCSLNDYAIREVYARDTKGQPAAFVFPASPSRAGTVMPEKGEYQREQENKGRFTKFKKSKKKSEQAVTASAPASPVLVSKPRPLSMALPSTNSSPLHSPTSPSDGPKKRRAPLPPGLMSHGGPLDLSTRRRLHSEPGAQLDGDQAPRLSRGSSTDSSLKRTKRKAPPPPSSPSLAVQEKVPLDENSQGGAATNTLEEIMEKEETAASVISATASETQGDDGKLETPADGDVTQNAECKESNSPPADAEVLSVPPVDESGEDQSPDLSSDGNHMQSPVNDSATHKDLKTTTDTDTPGVAATESGPCQDDNVCQQTICEEFTAESVKDESQTECSIPPSLPQPAVQNAEAQASVQAYIDTLREETGMLESSADTSMSCPIREDAQVQTDFTEEPVPSQQHRDGLPSSANAPGFDSAEKKDMTTSMEEMNPPDLKPALALTPETSDPTPSPAVTPKAAIDSMPPPKPSNELTRDYIPKVGMTTYTIVPQKYMEKLRYYEVELTLETPSGPSEKGKDISSGQPEECTAQRGQTEGAVARQEMLSTLPREDFHMSKQTTTMQTTVNGTLPDPIQSSSITTASSGAEDHISSFANRASQGDLPAEVKEMKIPPATKPKPGSFRFAQHKRTSGYYVTSAAGKSPPPVSPVSGQREAHLSFERENLPPPPPPPPTEQCEEDSTGATKVELSSKEDDDKNTPILRLTRQCSLPTKERSSGLSLEKLRSFAAPRPYSPFTPSRFAQAVSSAVKRSHSLSHGPKSPQSPVSPVLSPVGGHSSIPPLKELSKSEESDTTKLDGGEGSAPQGAAGGPSFIDIAPKEASSP